jgi:hypothetical protein
MKLFDWRKGLFAVLISVALMVTGCQPKPPSQFAATQESSSKSGAVAVAKVATQGGEFNKFFPTPGAGYERVYTQEKKGFAEAKLKKDGKELAMLAISDTRSNPTAAAAFKDSQLTIDGYPSRNLGTTQTSVLVGNYQVKVISRDALFTQDDRQIWLKKFNLKGLEGLK